MTVGETAGQPGLLGSVERRLTRRCEQAVDRFLEGKGILIGVTVGLLDKAHIGLDCLSGGFRIEAISGGCLATVARGEATDPTHGCQDTK